METTRNTITDEINLHLNQSLVISARTTIERDIKITESYIEDYKRLLTENLLKHKRLLHELKYTKEHTIDFREKVDEMLRNPKVEDVTYSTYDQCFKIKTKALTLIASNGGCYAIGDYTIYFYPNNAIVRFYNNKVENKRRSYWGSACHHPHVSDSGTACLGNATEMIAYLASDFEYGALVDILIAFLEQANLEDPAGQFVMNWDKILADGTIQAGYIDAESDDFTYGDTPEEDKYDPDHDGKIYCECCDAYFDEDEVTYIENEDRYVCENCRDDYYNRCDRCDDWTHNDNLIRTVDGDYVCECCRDEYYTWCEECEEYVRNEDYNDDMERCQECVNENYTWCDTCWEYVSNKDYDQDAEMCKACADENLDRCEVCDNLIYGEAFISQNEQVVCETCFNNQARTPIEESEEN